eukprot:gene2504-2809_t
MANAAYYDAGDRLSAAVQATSAAIFDAAQTSKAQLAASIGNSAAKTSTMRSAGYKVFDGLGATAAGGGGGRKLHQRAQSGGATARKTDGTATTYYDAGDRLSAAVQATSAAIFDAAQTSKAQLAASIGNSAAKTSTMRSAGYKVFDGLGATAAGGGGGRKLHQRAQSGGATARKTDGTATTYYDAGDRLSAAVQATSAAIFDAAQNSKAQLAASIGNSAAKTSTMRSAGYKVFDGLGATAAGGRGGRKLLSSDADLVNADRVANILSAARQTVQKQLKADMHAHRGEELDSASAASDN